MVDLSREEIEGIAEKVRREYSRSDYKTSFTSKIRHFDQAMLPWMTGLLGLITFLLIRRGSGWYLFTGALLVLAIINLLLIHNTPKKN